MLWGDFFIGDPFIPPPAIHGFTVYRRLKNLWCLIISDIKMLLYAIADINFLTKMQKKANPIERELPFCENKSSKNGCSDEVKISWIMSTDWYHRGIYALLQNNNLRGIAGDEESKRFSYQPIYEGFLWQSKAIIIFNIRFEWSLFAEPWAI